ncbi:MAG: ABC transporter ATP-binding protein [Verrucomicrobia bacterium]|nr:ABC transporter ATP-binding protein [Verrucomicrobiota bacterium]
MSTPLVEMINVTRRFGFVQALRGVTFTLERGQVAGLIGANGAGKTTAMRILTSLDEPDTGTVRIDGIDVVEQPNLVRRRIGWMPDHFQPYKDTTVGDYLDFFARAHGYRGAELKRRLAEVIDFTDLTPLVSRPMDRLSKGQTQRLCLGRTLLNDPDLLLLDEPAAGLDPRARMEFKNLVRMLRERGKTLLISSHILSELAEMCDTLVFMDAGRVVHQGDKASLLRHEAVGEGGGALPAEPGAAPKAVFEIEVAGPVVDLTAWLEMRAGWRLLETRSEGARAEFSEASPERVALEVRRLANDLPLLSFHRQERRLEEAFIDILRTGAGPRLKPQPEMRPPPLPGGAGGDTL